MHADRIHLPITKNGRPFDLPIVDVHREILESMRSLGREWVFPARKSRSGHLQCPKRIEWSPHAHRRTFATVAMEADILEEIVGRLLDHTPSSSRGRETQGPRWMRCGPQCRRCAMSSVREAHCDWSAGGSVACARHEGRLICFKAKPSEDCYAAACVTLLKRAKPQGEGLMPTKITTAQLKSRIEAEFDTYALELLPSDSFAHHAHETKPYPAIRGAHSAADADKEEREFRLLRRQ